MSTSVERCEACVRADSRRLCSTTRAPFLTDARQTDTNPRRDRHARCSPLRDVQAVERGAESKHEFFTVRRQSLNLLEAA